MLNMQFGIILNITADKKRSDADVLHEHFALGDLAERFGFDSLFTLEHHFTDYVISPAPLQTLAYYAGRTTRIKLGTAVVVLPWHDPVRVAEQVSMLDIMCGGRCIFAFGRGAAISEFEGFRIPMSESRVRFAESAKIVVGCLTNQVFKYDGEFYRIPPISIRPRPASKVQERFYGSSMGQESAEIIARLGFGMLLSTQKNWTTLGNNVARFNAIATAAGHKPKAPIITAMISVAKSRDQARERAHEYLEKDLAIIDNHYSFSKGQLTTVQGYESYADTEQYFVKLLDKSFRRPALLEYMKMQLIGNPDDCIQQIEELSRLTGLAHLLLEFSYGGMPYKEAQRNMSTFASHVMTVIHRNKDRHI